MSSLSHGLKGAVEFNCRFFHNNWTLGHIISSLECENFNLKFQKRGHRQSPDFTQIFRKEDPALKKIFYKIICQKNRSHLKKKLGPIFRIQVPPLWNRAPFRKTVSPFWNLSPSFGRPPMAFFVNFWLNGGLTFYQHGEFVSVVKKS